MHSRLVLRPARAADLPAVAAVWHAAWHAAHAACVPAELMAHRTLPCFCDRAPALLPDCWIAEQAGTLVGFVAWNVDRLAHLFVAPAACGQGIGAALLAQAEAAMAAQGIAEARLECAVGNDRARRFYAQHDWHEVGIEMYAAPIAGGSLPVRVHRLCKRLGRAP